ncbi:ATP-binding cassette domain-containing protein [Mesorhizobium sp. ASY16-5R]|uniref:ATP-binding cassette domain-containing protein n=1 Tax=Mesorhizobium sp. ASY16-5R TaxID=3445772 RepID=UPI003FA0EBBC
MTKDILGRYRLDIAPKTRVGDLPLGRQQMIEIVRAVERNPHVLLLDEATAALGASEVEWLWELVVRLRREGKIVLFISHRWDEIVRFSNRVAVLRNGELVGMADTAELPETEAVRLMTGRATGEESFPHKPTLHGGVALSADDLRSDTLRGVGFELRRGEILGLGGLVGEGQGHLLESLFGAHRLTAGSIRVDGKPLDRPTPRRVIRAGLAYVPQERKTEGLLLSKSVGRNLTLAILDRLPCLFGIIEPRREARLTREAIEGARIRTRGGSEPIRNLSGGNQQKVLLERWLLAKPSILLLNDVTRGIDIGTKRQIYETIAAIARQGVGVIWYSTDARELVGVAHRVLVMLGGRVSAELKGADVTVDRIVHAAVMGSAKPAERRP